VSRSFGGEATNCEEFQDSGSLIATIASHGLDSHTCSQSLIFSLSFTTTSVISILTSSFVVVLSLDSAWTATAFHIQKFQKLTSDTELAKHKEKKP
jgi:hypothetical protein